MLPFNRYECSWLNQVMSKILEEFLKIYTLDKWKIGSGDMKFINAFS